MAERPCVIFCCNTAFAVWNYRAGVIQRLLAEGFRVVVVAPPDEYVQKLAGVGAEFVAWRLSGRGTQPFAEVSSLLQLQRIFRRLKPVLVFNFTIKAVIYGALAAKRSGVPSVSVITGLGYAFINRNWISRLARSLYRLSLRHSHQIWFLNPDDKKEFERLGLADKSTSQVLPGEGVDTAHFQPELAGTLQSDKPFCFLLIARLLEDKGIREFVEAARGIKRQIPHVRFVLLGEAASGKGAILVDEVRSWERQNLIEYLGVVGDVRPVIAAADCVVLPSYREGLPRSLLEAAAMGKPLLATDVPGCREVVVSGENGLLCSPRSAESLQLSMLAMLQLDEAARQRMGSAARERVVTHYDEQRVHHYYSAVLQQFLNQD